MQVFGFVDPTNIQVANPAFNELQVTDMIV